MSLLQQLIKINKQCKKLLPQEKTVKLPSKQELENEAFLKSLVNHALTVVTQGDIEALSVGDIVLLTRKGCLTTPILLYKVEYTVRNVRSDFDGFIAVCTKHNITYKRIYAKEAPNCYTLDVFFNSLNHRYNIYILNKTLAESLGVFNIINPNPKYDQSTKLPFTKLSLSHLIPKKP